MIAARIERKAQKDNFTRLGLYVLHVDHVNDPKLYERTAEYIMDAKGDPERVVAALVSNCLSDDFRTAIREIEAVQGKNTRSQKDKSYHLVISFREGERPPLETLRAIEAELVAAIGYQDHQRISAVHDDTSNLHVHVAINKVHPATFRNVEPYYDKAKLMSACIELEAKYGLQVDNHGTHAEKRQAQAAKKMEAYSGRETLQAWIAANAMPALDEIVAAASSWAQVQAGFGKFGLEVRARGAGLVVGQVGEALCVKASSISPNLAFKTLTDRFGPLERSDRSAANESATDSGVTPPGPGYTKGPRQAAGASKALWERYQAERAASLDGRKGAHAKLGADFAKYDTDLRAYHKERREKIQAKLYLSGPDKRAMYKRLKEERQADWSQRRDNQAQQRAAVNALHPLLTWQAFLQREAERGDEAALGSLRSQADFRSKQGADILKAADMTAARNVIFRQLDPRNRRKGERSAPLDLKADKNGDLVYRVADGGKVTDTKGEVRCDDLSIHAAFLTLSIAAEKFAGQALIIDGTQAFKGALIEVAALPGWDIQFADPAMEAARLAAIAARDAKRPEAQERGSGAAEYVAARNAARDTLMTIKPHRLWEAGDAGDALYAGRRGFADGSEAILLERGGEILVKPSTDAQTARASTWPVGATVTTDQRGRFVAAPAREAGQSR